MLPQVVIDNRSGAGGTIGTNIVAEANPDGYTLLAHSSGYAIAPALYPKWKVDMLCDFQGISTLVSSPHVMTISPSLGPKTLKEFGVVAIRAIPPKRRRSSPRS